MGIKLVNVKKGQKISKYKKRAVMLIVVINVHNL